jgi:putative flippase GtrA
MSNSAFSSITAIIDRLRNFTAFRYLLVSVGALIVDMVVFLAILSVSGAAAAASAIGYCCGIIAHWLLSSRKVFADRVASGGFDRTRQKAMFVISALIGLGLTVIIVASADQMGFDARIAKLAAIATSFVATYLLRNHLVFRQWV